MTDVSALIAEARAQASKPRIGRSIMREFDRDNVLLNRLADALEEATREIERGSDRVAAVWRAWNVPGPVPWLHELAQADLKRTWPSLYSALRDLVGDSDAGE